jgi:hypothetical protein
MKRLSVDDSYSKATSVESYLMPPSYVPMLKGIVFKYGANPSKNGDLRDGADNGCGLEDPGFGTNGFPVWSICGPYVR